MKQAQIHVCFCVAEGGRGVILEYSAKRKREKWRKREIEGE